MTDQSTPAKEAAKPAAEKATVKKTATPAKVVAATKPATPKKAPAKRVNIADIKPKKIKMVSDSFTMPKDEFALLATCKSKCLNAGVRVKKSTLLRAGLIYLSKLADTELIAAVAQVEKIKTEKPAKA